MTSLTRPAIVAILFVSATAGALPLQVPDGWDSRKQDEALLLTPKDLGSDRFYAVLVPELRSKVGSVRGLLDAAKVSLGEAGTFTPATEPARGRNDQGWEYDVVIGRLEKDGKTLYAQVMGLKKGDEEGTIIVIADSVETLQRYSDPFTAMIKTLGATAPAAAAAAGGVDVKYAVPAGWTSRPIEGAVLLEKSADTMYDKYTFRIAIFPSQPLQDSLRKTYLASWGSIVAAALETTIAPLPLMRRLGNGAAVAYDVDTGAKNKSGQAAAGGLIVVAQGTRYVPILVVFYGGVLGDQLEADVGALLASVEIPKAGTARVAMFAPAEIVGDWNESSTSFASYVTPSGGYAGDASITTASTVTLGADGAFKRTFIGLKSGLTIREKDEGKWRLDDALLVETGKERRTHIVHGVGVDAKAGAFLVLSTYANQDEKPRFCNPRGAFQGTWYKRKE